MNPLFAAAVDVQRFCQERDWDFCFIGALAVQRWGEPRLTLDVDLTLLTGFGSEEVFADALLQRFTGRTEEAREFSLRHRVLLLRSEQGVPLDIAFGAMPFEERAVGRASDFPIEAGASLKTCSAEDLVVFKAFAGRDKDWLDLDGIALRQKDRLDQSLIFRELIPLLELKEAPQAAERLRRLLSD